MNEPDLQVIQIYIIEMVLYSLRNLTAFFRGHPSQRDSSARFLFLFFG